MLKSRLYLLKQGKIFLLLLIIMLLGFLFLENQERERKVIYRGKAGEDKEAFLAEGKYESLEEKWSIKERDSHNTQDSHKASSSSESGEKAISMDALEEEKKSTERSGEPKAALASAGESSPESLEKGETDAQKQGKKININTATEEELESLKGIGPATAKNIISYREEYGGFSSIEEIKNVKRIGDKTFEKIKEDICV